MKRGANVKQLCLDNDDNHSDNDNNIDNDDDNKNYNDNDNENHNSVNCDRPGECSPEKDCLR